MTENDRDETLVTPQGWAWIAGMLWFIGRGLWTAIHDDKAASERALIMALIWMSLGTR